MTKFVLNETSYFGKGAREELPREIKERGFKKVLVVTDKAFELPEDFEFSNRLVDGNFGAVFKQKSEHYKIEFYREAQMVVKERKWAENQIIKDEENKTIIEFDSTQFLKIKAWVLSNGCNAKPLEPEWLVKEWKKHAVEMAKMVL